MVGQVSTHTEITVCYLCNWARLRNDLYCVEWGVKLYSLTHYATRSTTESSPQDQSSTPYCQRWIANVIL